MPDSVSTCALLSYQDDDKRKLMDEPLAIDAWYKGKKAYDFDASDNKAPTTPESIAEATNFK